MQTRLASIEDLYSFEKIVVLRDVADKILKVESEEMKEIVQMRERLKEKKTLMSRWGGLFTTVEEDNAKEAELKKYREKHEKEIAEKYKDKKGAIENGLQ